MNTPAKSYYARSDTLFPYEIFPINDVLACEIVKYTKKSVFEFGCHDGRNLALIQLLASDIEAFGIDVNLTAIVAGRERFKLPLLNGDEDTLKQLPTAYVDVAFTNSVLCHIEDIRQIVDDLKRIAKIGVMCVETNDKIGQYYYQHDYKSFGFRKFNEMRSVPQPKGNGAVYEFWWHQK